MRQITRALVISCFCLSVACDDEAAPGPMAAPQVDPENLSQEEYAESEGLELKKFDLNRDKVPDIFKFYQLYDDPKNPGNKLEKLVRKEIDINHDGRIDVVRTYDDDQEIAKEETDLDFDGKVDEIAYYQAGALIRKEIDLDYNGTPDVKKYYNTGRISRIETDRDSDGRVDTWEYYEGGELDRIGTDTNGDGEVDHWDKKREAVPAAEEETDTVAEPEKEEEKEKGVEGEEGESEEGEKAEDEGAGAADEPS